MSELEQKFATLQRLGDDQVVGLQALLWLYMQENDLAYTVQGERFDAAAAAEFLDDGVVGIHTLTALQSVQADMQASGRGFEGVPEAEFGYYGPATQAAFTAYFSGLSAPDDTPRIIPASYSTGRTTAANDLAALVPTPVSVAAATSAPAPERRVEQPQRDAVRVPLGDVQPSALAAPIVGKVMELGATLQDAVSYGVDALEQVTDDIEARETVYETLVAMDATRGARESLNIRDAEESLVQTLQNAVGADPDGIWGRDSATRLGRMLGGDQGAPITIVNAEVVQAARPLEPQIDVALSTARALERDNSLSLDTLRSMRPDEARAVIREFPRNEERFAKLRGPRSLFSDNHDDWQREEVGFLDDPANWAFNRLDTIEGSDRLVQIRAVRAEVSAQNLPNRLLTENEIDQLVDIYGMDRAEIDANNTVLRLEEFLETQNIRLDFNRWDRTVGDNEQGEWARGADYRENWARIGEEQYFGDDDRGTVNWMPRHGGLVLAAPHHMTEPYGLPEALTDLEYMPIDPDELHPLVRDQAIASFREMIATVQLALVYEGPTEQGIGLDRDDIEWDAETGRPMGMMNAETARALLEWQQARRGVGEGASVPVLTRDDYEDLQQFVERVERGNRRAQPNYSPRGQALTESDDIRNIQSALRTIAVAPEDAFARAYSPEAIAALSAVRITGQWDEATQAAVTAFRVAEPTLEDFAYENAQGFDDSETLELIRARSEQAVGYTLGTGASLGRDNPSRNGRGIVPQSNGVLETVSFGENARTTIDRDLALRMFATQLRYEYPERYEEGFRVTSIYRGTYDQARVMLQVLNDGSSTLSEYRSSLPSTYSYIRQNQRQLLRDLRNADGDEARMEVLAPVMACLEQDGYMQDSGMHGGAGFKVDVREHRWRGNSNGFVNDYRHVAALFGGSAIDERYAFGRATPRRPLDTRLTPLQTYARDYLLESLVTYDQTDPRAADDRLRDIVEMVERETEVTRESMPELFMLMNTLQRDDIVVASISRGNPSAQTGIAEDLIIEFGEVVTDRDGHESIESTRTYWRVPLGDMIRSGEASFAYELTTEGVAPDISRSDVLVMPVSGLLDYMQTHPLRVPEREEELYIAEGGNFLTAMRSQDAGIVQVAWDENAPPFDFSPTPVSINVDPDALQRDAGNLEL